MCGVQVVAGINQKLQLLVGEAQAVAASGDSSTASQLLALQTSISKLGAVQQDVVDSIAVLAAKLAENPAYDATLDLSDFQDVSVLCRVGLHYHNVCVWHRAFHLGAGPKTVLDSLHCTRHAC